MNESLSSSVAAVLTSADPPTKRRAFVILNNAQGKHIKDAGDVFAFSPSQVGEFRLCPRKWGFKAIDRIYPPAAASAALGTDAHTLWEDYLRTGVMPSANGKIASGNTAKIAEATLKFLPLPGIARVEGEAFVLIQDDDGALALMNCRIDFDVDDQGRYTLDQLGTCPPGWSFEENPREGVPLIGDHKTTSSFNYAKAAEDLIGLGTRDEPGDAQATCYALVARLKNPEAQAVDLFWSYSRTKGAKAALPVRARFSLTDHDRSLSFLWQDVEAMRRAKLTAKRANDLPVNPEGCDAFGGCPHRSRCEITNEEKLSIMSNAAPMALANLLNVQVAPAATSAPLPAAPAAPGPSMLTGLLNMPAVAVAPAPPPAALPVLSLPGLLAPVAPPAPPPAPVAPVVVVVAAPAAPDLVAAAKHYFTQGKQPVEAECGVHYAGVVGEFNRLVMAAQPLPADAPNPAQVAAIVAAAAPSLPAAPTPQATPQAAPAAATPEVETDAAEGAKKGKAPRAPRGSKIDASDPIALLKAAVDAAIEIGNFRLVSNVAEVLAIETDQK